MTRDLEFQRQAARDGSVIRRRHDENVVVPRDFTGRVVDPSGTWLFFAGMPIPLDDREWSAGYAAEASEGYDPFPGEEAPAVPEPPRGRRVRPHLSARYSGGIVA